MVPFHAPKLPVTFRSHPDGRMEDALAAVDVFRIALDLGADEVSGKRVDVSPPNLRYAAVLDLDLEAAGVWAIEGAGTLMNLGQWSPFLPVRLR